MKFSEITPEWESETRKPVRRERVLIGTQTNDAAGGARAGVLAPGTPRGCCIECLGFG